MNIDFKTRSSHRASYKKFLMALAVLLFSSMNLFGQGKKGPVSDHLYLLEKEVSTPSLGKSAAGPTSLKEKFPFFLINGDQITVSAIPKTNPEALLRQMEALGMKNGRISGNLVGGNIPFSAIASLQNLTELRFVRPTYAQTNAGIVTSQGDQAMRSDISRATYGLDGTGITVGVLSDTYDNNGGTPLTTAADDIASGDLPAAADINILDDTAGGGIDEGRAMMQLIHDVAPGAKQAFHTAFGGEVDFALGIIELAVAGSDVIVDDVFYYAEPMFADGVIAQAVDIVRDTYGVPYFSSAGNSGRKSYQSAFSSSGIAGFFGGQTHDFDPGVGVDNLQTVTFPPGQTVLSFQWDQPYASTHPSSPGSASDVDILFYDMSNALMPFISYPGGSLLVVYHGYDGNVGGDPVEIAAVINNGAAPITLQIGIELYSGVAPGLLKYVYFGSMSVDEYATNSSTVVGHSNARGAQAVGASAYFNTPEFGDTPAIINGFSSAGVTPILFDIVGNRLASAEVRVKPDYVGPDGGNTTFFFSDYEPDGFPNFFGTSASAPHVAAVAALMLQADPTLEPSAIRTILQETAADMDDPITPSFDTGYDDRTGYGFVQADVALARVTRNNVLLANNKIKVDGNKRSAGDIHSNDKVSFSRGKPGVHNGNISAVKDVTIETKNTINGDVTAGDDLSILGNSTAYSAIEAPVAPQAMPNLDYAAGSTNVTVEKKKEYTLAPGKYGTVQVNKSGTLNLASGNYYINILDTDKSAKIVIDVTNGLPAYINIVEELDIDNRVEISIIAPAGKDGIELVNFSSLQRDKIEIGKNSLILGNITAPYTEVAFSRGSAFKGTVIADDISIEEGVPFIHTSTSGLPKRAFVPDDEELVVDAASTITDYELHQNYPNPFNPTTSISFSLADAGLVNLTIYNSAGQVVRKLAASSFPKGKHSISWNATDDQGANVASGIYFYRLQVNDFISNKKLTLLK